MKMNISEKGNILVTASAFSLSMSLIDISTSIIMNGSSDYSSFLKLLAIITVTGLASILIFALFLIFTSAAKLIININTLYASVSFSVFILSFYLFIKLNTSLYSLFLSTDIDTITLIEKFAPYFAISLFIGIALYFIFLLMANKRTENDFTSRLLLILPFIIIQIITLTWIFAVIADAINTVKTAGLIFSFLPFPFSFIFFYIRKEKFYALPAITAYLFLLIAWAGLFNLISEKETPKYLSLQKNESIEIKHVILFTVDTLRYDVLSCSGNMTFQTPGIDGIASGSIIYDNAYSSSSWTLPSFASLFTGVSPAAHLTTKLKSRLPPAFTTLAEYMRRKGYYTAAIGDNPILALESNNICRGFTYYNFFPKRSLRNSVGEFILKKYFRKYFVLDASTEEMTAIAQKWISVNINKPFFLWIHYLDPHIPYNPPERFISDKKTPEKYENTFNDLKGIRTGRLKLSEEEKKWAKSLYEAEVRYVDENVGRLSETLKELNIYDDSLIIFTSDHGEEFWEHNGFEHGHTMYNELIHIPLMIKLPQAENAGKVEKNVTLASLFSTVLKLCQINSEAEMYSASPLPLKKNDEPAYREVIFSSGNLYFEPKESIIDKELKLIISKDSGKKELYDIIEDPLEKTSFAESLPLETSKLGNLITRHYANAMKIKKKLNLDNPENTEIDAETQKRLKSLGYLN